MSGRSRITVTIDEKVVVVRGWRAIDLIRSAGLRATFSGAAAGGGGWILDRRRLADLLAYLDGRRVPVVIVDLAEGDAGGAR